LSKKKSVPKDAIRKESAMNTVPLQISPLEKKIFDFPILKKDGNRENSIAKNPYIVLKYYQADWECFSAWNKPELKCFSDFIQKLSTLTWGDIYNTAGSPGNKIGVGYTTYQLSKMKTGSETLKKVQSLVSPELTFFELRLSKKIRVHGFQSQSAFFLVMLDKDHRVFS
jgi:hypothetical protein